MALKITPANEIIRVERLNLVIYGPPGIGKTSLAFTAESPLLLDFDKGSHRAAGRKDTVQVSSWSDVSSITEADLAPYSTVIMDTAGRALDCLTIDIIKANPKHGRSGGALSLQGYGELKSRFTDFLRLLNSFGKDVILIAHMDEQRSGDDIVERLDVQGGSKNEIYKAADAMGRLSIHNNGRMLRFSPSDAAFGKNPGQLPPLNVPDVTNPAYPSFLADVIQQTKDKLNEMSEGQQEEMARLAAFQSELQSCETAKDVNGLIDRAREGGPKWKAMLHKHATEKLGLSANKATGQYDASEAA